MGSIKKNAGWLDIIHVSNEKIGRDINSPDLKTAFGQKILYQIVNKVKIETLPKELIIGRISQFSPASQWLLTTLNIIKS